MPTWYKIQAAAEGSDSATISILSEIGMWGITAQDFIRELKAVSAPKLNVEINSPGGSVFDGLAIYNALRASGKEIHTKVLGLAASMASVLLLAGDKRTIAANAFVMVHAPMGGAFGNAGELRDTADLLDKIEKSIADTYVSRTGQTPEAIADLMSTDTWLSADEALAKGFVDSIDPALTLKASFDMEKLPKAIQDAFAADPDEDETDDGQGFVVEDAVEAVKAAGLEAFSADLLLACSTLDQVKAKVAVAREVKALCAVLNADASDFIKAGKSYDAVRAELAAKRADTTEVDTSQPPADKQKAPAAKVVSTAAIWAKRKKQNT